MRRSPLAVAASTLLITRAAMAQSAPASPPTGWAIGAEAGLNAARGNSSYTTLSTGVRFSHLDKKQFEFEASGGITYSESNNKVMARRILGGLKGDLHPQATWSPFVFATAERDRIRRLDLLTNGGAGAKWTYYRNPRGAASMSAAGVYTYKSITPSATPPATPGSEPRQSTARLSLRPKLVQKYASGLSVEQISFWQPVLGNVHDYTVEANSRLGFAVTKTQSIFAQHIYRLDSRPPVGVKREDQLMLVGLKIQF